MDSSVGCSAMVLQVGLINVITMLLRLVVIRVWQVPSMGRRFFVILYAFTIEPASFSLIVLLRTLFFNMESIIFV